MNNYITKLFLQTARQANEMSRNITEMQKAIQEKEGFMALAHTRLGNRAQRLRMELCRYTIIPKNNNLKNLEN